MKVTEIYAVNQDRADRNKISRQYKSDEFMNSLSRAFYNISIFISGVVVGYIILPALRAVYGS